MPPDAKHDFVAALLEPDAPVPHNVVDPHGRIAPKRFAVYRNNVTVSLIEALKATFPAVVALVGEAFFGDMARRFVRRTPPNSPLLFRYGAAFPEFIAGHDPAADLPFLADVARLDRTWLDAYHAADGSPFAPEVLAGWGEAELMTARFVPLPATRLVASDFPLVTIWQAARDGRKPQFADRPEPEWALVTRPDISVSVAALAPVDGQLFSALIAGQKLGEAAEAVLAKVPGFDFSAALVHVVSGGGFASVSPSKLE